MRNENKNLCNPDNVSYRITNLRTHKTHRKFLRAEDKRLFEASESIYAT